MFTIYDEDENKFVLVEEPDASLSYTYADYVKWKFEEQVELIKGRIYKMSPAPTTLHQQVSSRLHGEMYPFFKGKSCQLFPAPFDVRLPVKNRKRDDEITTVVQPDICVICDETKLDKRGCVGAPDLMIEVLSTATQQKDKTIKWELYEEAGIKEYWIVSPIEENVAVYILNSKGKYDSPKIYSGKVVVCSQAVAGLEINLDDIFI